MRNPFIENSRPLITIVSHHDLFMTTRYFVPRTLFWCPLKRPSVKLTKLLVTLLLHADWMILKNASNQGGAKSVTVAPLLTKSRPRMLVASKAAFLENYFKWRLALGFEMDLLLNATRRSIILLLYLAFDLESRRFKFLDKICWALGRSKMSFPPLTQFISCSKSQRKTHQITQMRHFELQKCCNEQTV